VCYNGVVLSGVNTPPALEKKPSPRRVPYSSRSSYNSAGRKIKGRGAVVSSCLPYLKYWYFDYAMLSVFGVDLCQLSVRGFLPPSSLPPFPPAYPYPSPPGGGGCAIQP